MKVRYTDHIRRLLLAAASPAGLVPPGPIYMFDPTPEPYLMYQQAAKYWQEVALGLMEDFSTLLASTEWERHRLHRVPDDADGVEDMSSIAFWEQYGLEWQTSYEKLNGFLDAAEHLVQSRLHEAYSIYRAREFCVDMLRDELRELPYGLELVLIAAEEFSKQADRQFEELAEAFGEWKAKEPILAEPAAKILSIVKTQQESFKHDFMAVFLLIATLEEQAPRFVCWQILRECQTYGEPKPTTLEILGLDWVIEHLPEPPQSLSMLLKGLRWNQAERNSGETRDAFSLDKGSELGSRRIATHTLRRYDGWRKKIEEFANTWIEEQA